MMVLTKRVGDSPESRIPSLEVFNQTTSHSMFCFLIIICFVKPYLQTAIRRIQTAFDSGEWIAICAKSSSVNPKFFAERNAAPTRSEIHQSHGASPEQASVSNEIKSGSSLGAGMAAAAELEESVVRAVNARSSSNPTFSPNRGGAQSPKSVSCLS